MNSRLITACCAIALLISLRTAHAAPGDVVEAYMAAYNRHDVAAIQSYFAADVRWLSVTGDAMSTESSGRNTLASGLREYFAALPSARSAILAMHGNGNFVSVIEEARWTANEQTERQCALAVYEIEKELIKHVWYFANQSCAITAE